SPAALRQLLAEWNDTRSPDAPEMLMHQFFEAQAAAAPGAVAVLSVAQHLSYRELNRRANRLAHHLRAMGLRPEELVGICMGRSPAMVVAILGVLKAGGAYLPLDPGYPPERLAFMLEDAGVRVLLSDAGQLAALPRHRAQVVRLDGDQVFPEQSLVDPLPTATASNLAYLIYTSGSTGRAKGVAIAHRSAAAMLEWAREEFTPQEVAGVLASTSICFDLSVFELFVPLSRGGAVILAESALDLPELPAAGAVTLVNTVPSALRELQRLAGLPRWVRTINLAGEALPRELVDGAYRQPGVERVLNLYGPSEDTTYSTFARLRRGSDGAPPIGRPVSDTRAYVLDRHQQPVPPGVPGELYLGGEGLARCYLDRPALTAERWVPDPFCEEGGERLYRTGDLVRVLPAGELAFLGRLDHQVKVRGFRIELGEVEAVLVRHPAVREAVVVVVEEHPLPARLMAYLVAEGESPPAGALRDHLLGTLPEYMVPSAFVSLEALPLGSTGKVDRAALGRRTLSSAELLSSVHVHARVAPRSPLEEVMAGIWSEVLGIDEVGVHDDFFELGGHSLLATQVTSRASRSLGVELAVRQLFEKRTVAALAAEVERLAAAGRGTPQEPLEPVPRSGPPPLSFAQERLWFLYQLQPASTAYNSSTVLRFEGSLDPEALRRAFEEIVRRHEVLRTTFAIVGAQPVQMISPPGEHPLPLVDLGALSEGDSRPELEAVVGREGGRRFDLMRGPLFRSILLRPAATPDREHVLLLSNHHIVFDGWSAGVVVRELAALYRALVPPEGDKWGVPPEGDKWGVADAGGRTAPSPLEPLPIQYADFACWQRRWLRGEVLNKQLAYWRARLEGSQPAARLAVDHPRVEGRASRGGSGSFSVSAATSDALRSLSRSQGATLFMTLIAAFQTLLHRHTGARTVVVGSPIANRNRQEIEALVGFFINIQVIRSDFADDPTFLELLERMREATLEDYGHQDLPFEKLVEALQPDRSVEPQPLFQALFVFQNAPSRPLELPGVTLRPMMVERVERAAMFDFSLAMGESGELLVGGIQYEATLFEAATIDVLLDHLRRLLDEIAADPDRRVGDYALLSEAERGRILDEGSRIDTGSTLWNELRERLAKTPPGGWKRGTEVAPRIYLLDRKRRLVPLGGEGEIYLEGIGPLAAELRSPHPFNEEPGSWLFATGVRGRWRADARPELAEGPATAAATAAGAGAEADPLAAEADPTVAEAAVVAQERAELSSRQSRLSEARRALLARRLRRRSAQAPAAETIARRPAQEPAYLSFSQEQLWFLDQLTPGLPVYNMPFPMRLSGRLDPAVLAATFAEILRRHEVLRATFRTAGDRPVMEFAPPAVRTLPLVDLAALAAPEREAQLRRLADADALRPFDLARGPVVRLTLLRLGDEDHVLIFNVHHIVFDGWSLGVLVGELTALYQTFQAARSARGTAPPTPGSVPEPPIQYGDFAWWQRQRLQGEVMDRQLAYWKQQLAGAPPLLALPTDRPRPTQPSFRGGSVPVRVSPDLLESLTGLGREGEATLFMTLLAAFKALLYRHSGQQDVVIGSPIAGRNRRELEGLIGFFVTTVALRTDLSGDPSFRRLLSRVRRVATDAFAHQDLPFELVVRELAPQRDPGTNPVFQVMFALQSAPVARAELPEGGLSLQSMGVAWRTAKFDLSLFLDNDETAGGLEYNTDLFDATTMERLVAHFERLLGAIVEDPERRLGELALLSAAEMHQLLVAWNDTDAAHPPAAGVHDLFAAQAARTPEAVALVLGDAHRSYRDLDRRSNRLANHLRGRDAGPLGVAPDVPVGVALERSPEAVEALLGVLKAGGVFVPLDRSYPAERLAFMLADAGVGVLVTRRELVAELPAHGARTVLLDADRERIERASAEPVASGAAAENLSYLIYTSGSTGRPKGVALVHRTLTNLIAWQLARSAPGARTLQFAAMSFDVYLQEVFSTLCSGGTLHLLREAERRDPVQLADLLAAQGIERLFLPFVALQQLAEVAAQSPPPALREVITAGEQLQITRQVERFFTRGRGCTLENQYGPSESHVVTAFPLAGPASSWPALPSIGVPVANFRVCVLDPRRRPVPSGVPGELFLAGAGLARGYYDRPELTAEKFLPDPYGGGVGGRMYATGDLGRLAADGTIEFLGRIDHQVKIRGFRIELGEIEAVLSHS
ncbi:MAG: amino acid adenylation domain-containing protein, partial [bacterium]|nr:amino acid adenylation domain-containing protein [bacterium]